MAEEQTDIFAIITVVVATLTVIFLIIAAIYFNGIRTWTSVPTANNTNMLFWTAIILAVLWTIMVIYGLYRIFTHRAVVCPVPTRRRGRRAVVTSEGTSSPIPVAGVAAVAAGAPVEPTSSAAPIPVAQSARFPTTSVGMSSAPIPVAQAIPPARVAPVVGSTSVPIPVAQAAPVPVAQPSVPVPMGTYAPSVPVAQAAAYQQIAGLSAAMAD